MSRNMATLIVACRERHPSDEAEAANRRRRKGGRLSAEHGHEERHQAHRSDARSDVWQPGHHHASGTSDPSIVRN